MDSAELKALFLQRVSLGGNELEAMSQAFSALYRSFQTDVVTRVRCSPVEDTLYTWIDPPSGRSNFVSLFFHGGGYTMGSTDDHLQLIASLVEDSGVSVLGVELGLDIELGKVDAIVDVGVDYAERLLQAPAILRPQASRCS